MKSRLQLVPFVHRTTHRLGLYLDAAEPPLGLSQGECHLLAHLAEAGSCSVAELHRAFAHKRSTLTSYLDRLEARGDVTREVRPEDRRSFTVRLSRTGARSAARVHQHLLALEDGALARLTERDLRGFQAVLHALSETIDGKASPGRRKPT
ncbi:MAG TPA: MarR family transcriptional regulator [Myxococcaceae bacterium]|nr:MarR family transcriptional regulator [Myxococcaceae bacterium]